MVKPTKTMQPEAVNLQTAGRDKSKAFGEDSFHNYMARKIDMQRQQFGLQLPPDPREYETSKTEKLALFLDSAVNSKHNQSSLSSEISRNDTEIKKRKQFGISAVVKRLKRKHGKGRNREGRNSIESMSAVLSSADTVSVTAKDRMSILPHCQSTESISEAEQSVLTDDSPAELLNRAGSSKKLTGYDIRKARPDLFFAGVVVLVNGYTNPDTETLQRLLHRHGGDLEKYETHRVTHIIAEHLSFAKAAIYKKARNPLPVCKPAWILDSVNARRVLPATDYLLDEVRNDTVAGLRSLTSFFGKSVSEGVVDTEMMFNDSTSVHPKTPLQDIEPELSQESVGVHVNSVQQAPKRWSAATVEDDDSTLYSRTPPHLDSHTTIEVDVGDSTLYANALFHPHPDCTTKINHGTVDFIHVAGETSSPKFSISEEAYPTKKSDHPKDRYIDGRIRTVGTDPNFLESFFAASRLSFIGSYKQRARQSPRKTNTLQTEGDRFVFHVDMDCFFASVVLRNYPQYKDKPVVISHHGEKKGSSSVPRDIPKASSSECATVSFCSQ
jgi:BRCT domain, a BRCA1 C-terminus domain/impB/mucB/samB family